MSLRFFVFICFIGSSLISLSQAPTDSVFNAAYALMQTNPPEAFKTVEEMALKIDKYTEEERHQFHHEAAQFYGAVGNFDQEIKHWQQKIALLPPKSDTLYKTRYRMALAHLNSAHWDEALEIFDQVRTHAMILGYQKGIAAGYDGMASVYARQGKNDEAIGYYLKALTLVEKARDTLSMAKVNTNMAIAYVEMNEINKAFEARKRAYWLVTGQDDPSEIAKAGFALGSSYNDMAKYDSAIFHLDEALTFFEQFPDARFLNGIYNDLGRAYTMLENYDEAEHYYLQSIQLLKAGGFEFALPGTLANYGLVLASEGNYQNGVKQCQEALPIARKMNYPGVELVACQCLYENFKGAQEHDSALFYLELLELLEDSISNVDMQKAALEQELTTDHNKEKESIISEANTEIKEAVSFRNLLIWSCIILILVLGVLYWAFRQNKRSKEMIDREKQYLDNLLHNLVHEFRTPLTLIKGPTEELLQSDNGNELLQMVNKNSEQMLHLVNQVLDFAKIKAGKLGVNNELTNPSLFLSGTLALFNPVAQDKRITLTFDDQTKQELINIDSDKLQKIVSNLLSNAIKYSESGATVKLLAKNNDKNLIVTVVDTGIGIALHEQENIFKKFYQIDATLTRKGEGTGLGLAFVQELVQLMGGTLTLNSELGKGTDISVSLPYQHVQQEATAPISSTEPMTTPAPPQPVSIDSSSETEKKQLLIVEDNTDLQRFLAHLLAGYNYEIHTANDGEEGISRALELVPDLIISDVMMPKKDGYQLVQALKKDPVTEHVPIIILTAKASFDSMLDGLGAGADDYVSKPFKSQEILLRINNQLKMADRLRQKYINQTESDEEQVEPVHPFIQKIEQLVLKDPSEQLSVEALAETCALSRSQLHRKVKFLTGLSTSALLTKIRLDSSIEDIKTTDLTIAEIAYKYGYSDPAHYSRLFKKQFNQTPTEYRKNGH